MQTPGLLVVGAGVSKDTVQRAVGYAKMAETRGFHSCLVSEAASDALSLAQHVASVTSRIQVGTAITNIYLRPPLLAALHALTINAIAPGRLFLGSNSRLWEKARKMGVGAPEFLRFGKLWGCVPSRV